MNNKVFVANLPFKIGDYELEDLFSKFGNVVSARVAEDRESYRSKGFGFVEMSTEDEANKSIQELNGFEVMGRKIAVLKSNK